MIWSTVKFFKRLPHYHMIMKRIKFLGQHALHCHVLNQIKLDFKVLANIAGGTAI